MGCGLNRNSWFCCRFLGVGKGAGIHPGELTGGFLNRSVEEPEKAADHQNMDDGNDDECPAEAGFGTSHTNHRRKWYFSGEGVLRCGKEDDRWLSLITRGMTTLPRAKKTSRIVSFLLVIGIMGKLLNGRSARAASLGTGHDADLGDPSLVKQIHDADKILNGKITVGPQDDGNVVLRFFQLDEPAGKLAFAHHLIIEFEGVVAVDGDGLYLSGIDRIPCGGTARNDEIHAVLHERRGNHEDDQQDKGEIEQGCHIQLAERVKRGSV